MQVLILFDNKPDISKGKISYVCILRRNLNDFFLRHDMNGKMKPRKITYGQFETKATE